MSEREQDPNRPTSILAETKHDVLAGIGGTLLMCQTAERTIGMCLLFVVPRESPITFDKLEEWSEKDRRATLGTLLKQLRDRVEVDAEFDSVLARFLKNRNILAHHLRDVPGWDLGEPEGREAATRFLKEVLTDAVEVTMTFAGFLRAWERQVGLNAQMDPTHEAWLKELDEYYAPRSDELFFARTKK